MEGDGRVTLRVKYGECICPLDDLVMARGHRDGATLKALTLSVSKSQHLGGYGDTVA
jgi:hypothetical protein